MIRKDKRIFTARLADFYCTIFGRAQTLKGEYGVKVFQVTASPQRWAAVMTPGADLALWHGDAPESCQRQVEKDFAARLTDWEVWNPSSMLAIPNSPAAVVTPRRPRRSPVQLIKVRKRQA